jgi:hypothetical protein
MFCGHERPSRQELSVDHSGYRWGGASFLALAKGHALRG